MAFSRARLKRFNEMCENTPGVGAYNVAAENKQGQFKDLDRSRYLHKLDLSCKQLRDKGIIAATKGELPKYVEELQHRLRATEERIIDFEILKIGADKGRELLQDECKSLSTQIIKLKENIQELELKKKQVEEMQLELKKEKSRLEIDNKKVASEKNELFVEVNNVISLLDVVKLESKEMQEKCKELEQSKLKLQEEISKLENQKMLANEEKQNFNAVLETVTKRSEEFHQKMLELENVVNDLRVKVESLTIEKQELLSELNKYEKTLAERNCDLSEVQQRLENLDHSKQSLQEVAEKLKAENKELSNERDNINHKLNKLANDFVECQLKLTDVEERKKICDNELHETNTRFKYLSEQATKEISELQDKISSLDSSNVYLNTQLSCFENLKNSNERECIANQKEIEIRDQQIAQLNLTLDNLQQRLDQEKVINRDELLDLHNKNEMLNNALIRKEKEITVLISEHDSDLEILEKQISREYHELVKKKKEKYLLKIALIEQNGHDFEAGLKQVYEEKVINLEVQKNNFEEKQRQIYEERKEQLNQEKTEFECSQKKFWEEKLKSFEEKIANFEVEQNIHRDKEKALENMKVNNEAEMLVLEKKVTSLEAELVNMKTESKRISEEMSATLEEKNMEMNASKKEFEQKHTHMFLEKVQVIEKEKAEYMKEQNTMWEEQVRIIEESKRSFQENLRKDYEERVQSMEMNIKEQRDLIQQSFEEKSKCIQKQMREIWIEQKQVLKESKINFQDMEMYCAEKLQLVVEKLKQEELEHIRSNEQLQKLETENDSLKTLLKEQIEKYNQQITEQNKDRQLGHDSDLLELEKLGLEKETMQMKYATLEMKYLEVTYENDHLCGLTELFQDKISRLSEQYEMYRSQQEAKYNDLTEAADRERNGLNNIISEMSEKIQQMEEAGAETDLEQKWKSMYEELEKRMEPFKDILDTYDLERQLLQDRDRYTSEQIEKLTKEAIKNMGHQNHRQKLKYVEKLKQENITLHKKFCETQEELHRKNALLKKYQERLEKFEGTKELCIKKTPATPRVPLKEGNR
uniref:Hyaluronan-mediated motility receptor C-terminal domain-containing protein n=1 Tax=Arion vulgaris TaxID=1028688 RepID=A0A0B7B3X0_9EUPU